ncbi:protease SohB [Reinekea blandensis]|uniref:Probable protease n=1 Tax=Reinekea blandensis MED297 TaxID=314283 RepID=A4BHL6_9GAMM|nr:protease SohB [Reinekea blandensis]EAR08414.1 probable protease [Reinekea blandensis MED297]
MWADYFLFLLKAITVLVVVVLVLMIVIRSAKEGHEPARGKLVIARLNRALDAVRLRMQQETLSKKGFKKTLKSVKEEQKKLDKVESDRPKAYALKFKGDIQASQVEALRQEVTAILTTAKEGEEVIITIESPGGSVSGYGLAASQLLRLKDKGLKLTACVDQVAASGGYMMACVADRILAAPFSIVGSIGVLSQVPNIHRFLKRFDVDVDVLTAGKHKAPITFMGENTEEGKQKHVDDLNAIHQRFKALVKLHREELNIDDVSEGDFWLAEDALQRKLVDELMTSDSYLMSLCESTDVYRVRWQPHKSLEQRIKGASAAIMAVVENRLWQRRLP